MVEVEKKVLAMSLIFSTLMFVIGVLLGRSVAEASMSDIFRSLEDIKISMLTLDTLFEMQSSFLCDENITNDLDVEIHKVGKDLEVLEKSLGYKNDKVLRLKEYYNLLLLRHYLLMMKANEVCGQKYVLILYFYSNDKKYVDACKEQGKYLDYIVYKYGKRVKVFAIEGELINNTAIRAMKERYGVRTYPTIIINGKKYEGLLTVKELEKIVSKELQQT